ncbi:hypothetical protein A0H81_09303 [Grifola frondosa]|uniref:Uncharacterized protein n=1 Tax=Grifola frondosa TaxID=5627 RepID=A0A1C7M216_GRIFR|nr:hypothetical protein A0H81_09303 [Grifola frondosa]
MAQIASVLMNFALRHRAQQTFFSPPHQPLSCTGCNRSTASDVFIVRLAAWVRGCLQVRPHLPLSPRRTQYRGCVARHREHRRRAQQAPHGCGCPLVVHAAPRMLTDTINALQLSYEDQKRTLTLSR